MTRFPPVARLLRVRVARGALAGALGLAACVLRPAADSVAAAVAVPVRTSSCDSAAASQHDPLRYAARGEGSNFIEILDLETYGSHLYACTGVRGLVIWATETDTAPQVRARKIGPAAFDRPHFSRCQHVGIDARAKRLVLTNRGDLDQPTPYFSVFSLDEPSVPRELATWSGSFSIEAVTPAAPYYYAAAHENGIVVFVEQSGTLSQVAQYRDEHSNAWKILEQGDYLFVAEAGHGLRVYRKELSPKAKEGLGLVPVARVPLSGPAIDVIARGDRLYLATSHGFATVDVRSPEEPKLLGETATPGTAVKLDIASDGTLLVADWDELRGYNLDHPQRPALAFAEVAPKHGPFSRVLAVASEPDGRVYAGAWRGLHVYRRDGELRGPDIALPSQSLAFGPVALGSTVEREFDIRNTGNLALTITGIESSSSDVRADFECRHVEPGESTTVEVTFSPSHSEVQAGDLRVVSDDIDEPETTLAWSGNLPGIAVGSPMPAIEGTTVDGRRVGPDDLRDKVVVLAYFASW